MGAVSSHDDFHWGNDLLRYWRWHRRSIASAVRMQSQMVHKFLSQQLQLQTSKHAIVLIRAHSLSAALYVTRFFHNDYVDVSYFIHTVSALEVFSRKREHQKASKQQVSSWYEYMSVMSRSCTISYDGQWVASLSPRSFFCHDCTVTTHLEFVFTIRAWV